MDESKPDEASTVRLQNSFSHCSGPLYHPTLSTYFDRLRSLKNCVSTFEMCESICNEKVLAITRKKEMSGRNRLIQSPMYLASFERKFRETSLCCNLHQNTGKTGFDKISSS